MTSTQGERVRSILARLETGVREAQYMGWDPYDALNSSLIRRMTFFHPLAQRIAIHLFRLSPLNLRPFLGVSKERNPTAMSVFIDAYVNLSQVEADPAHLERASGLVDHLLAMACVNTAEELGWGRNFKYITIGETHEMSTPLTFLNARIGQSILDLQARIRKAELTQLVERIIRTIIRQGRVYRIAGGTHIGYSSEPAPRLIFNASIVSARLFLSYLAVREKEDVEMEGVSLRGLSYELIETVLAAQDPQGWWAYGYTYNLLRRLGNIDFHQGFVIDSLLAIAPLVEQGDFRLRIMQAYETGLAFMADKQITPDGVFLWRYPRPYPTDIHNQAQGILSLSKAPHRHYDDRLERVLDFTLRTFWSERDGWFLYQKRPLLGINRVPYLRWAQGWMAYALSEYLKRGTHGPIPTR